MNIAFCINRLALIGFGVTVSSLIKNCSDQKKLNLWFLCANLTQKDKLEIKRLLDSNHFLGVYNFIDFDPIAHFGSFRSLHGDWTAYGRLLLPEVINDDQVLYLDSDLLVEVDVLEVNAFDFNNYALAAVKGGPLRNNLENKFYSDKLKLSPDLDSFNSGVLLINIKEWKLKKIKEECLRIANAYPMELLSCDQTLLNAVFAGNFAKLPQSFNCEWYADNPRPNVSEEMIFHFVGSPKPWDPLGFVLHNGYKTWKENLEYEWESSFGKLGFKDYLRAWKIRRSYIRCLRNKLKK